MQRAEVLDDPCRTQWAVLVRLWWPTSFGQPRSFCGDLANNFWTALVVLRRSTVGQALAAYGPRDAGLPPEPMAAYYSRKFGQPLQIRAPHAGEARPPAEESSARIDHGPVL